MNLATQTEAIARSALRLALRRVLGFTGPGSTFWSAVAAGRHPFWPSPCGSLLRTRTRGPWRFIFSRCSSTILISWPRSIAPIAHATISRTTNLTLHLTLLLVSDRRASARVASQFLPWIFTLYICWSPWHYTGQNYGLLLMFVRRSGNAMTTAERRWLRAAFVASYLMLLASFETGGSSDPLILSLGLPRSSLCRFAWSWARLFSFFIVLAFRRLVEQKGLRPMAAPLTLAFTQFLWFVLPTLLELHADYQIPQTRYSSGILAVLHSTQYIWITSYYQQRQERALGESGWRMSAYLLTLVAGGIALFMPGPWLVSYAFHFDFTTSFLIFLSLINIHHFLLDGALWKLRDSRISSLLVDTAKIRRANACQGSRDIRTAFLESTHSERVSF